MIPSRPAAILPVLLVLFLAGCASFSQTEETPPAKPAEPAPVKHVEPVVEAPPAPAPPPANTRHAEGELAQGVRMYSNGEYRGAATRLQNALNEGLANSNDQITAHKYLAFIYCSMKEQIACRGEFKDILALNPRFRLSAAEAGHPVWGPIFREVQAASSGSRKRKSEQ